MKPGLEKPKGTPEQTRYRRAFRRDGVGVRDRSAAPAPAAGPALGNKLEGNADQVMAAKRGRRRGGYGNALSQMLGV